MWNDHELAAYIGLDRGDQRHAVQMQPAGGGPVERLELDQRPDVLHAWVAQLRQRFHGRPVGIALEQRKGAVIHALMMYEFLVLYPVNPKTVARYREVFAPSGAKDDPTDAALLLDLLCTHRDKLRVWTPDTVEARTLCLLCEQRRKLVHHRVAVTNRLTSVLKQYFPQALDWVGTLASRQGCDFLRRWSTPPVAQRGSSELEVAEQYSGRGAGYPRPVWASFPAPARRHRLSPGGEPRPSRATRTSAAPVHGRATPPPGRQGQDTRAPGPR